MANNIKNNISQKSILKNNAIEDEQLPHKKLHRINLEGEEKFFDPQNITSSQTIKKDDSNNNEDNFQIKYANNQPLILVKKNQQNLSDEDNKKIKEILGANFFKAVFREVEEFPNDQKQIKDQLRANALAGIKADPKAIQNIQEIAKNLADQLIKKPKETTPLPSTTSSLGNRR